MWNYALKEPSASRIELVSGFGEPAIYSKAQAEAADKLLDSQDPDRVREMIPPTPKAKSSGCSFGGGAGGAVGLGLAAVAFVAFRRRRK
jgi:MYXO-CTERM domain-containing protein